MRTLLAIASGVLVAVLISGLASAPLRAQSWNDPVRCVSNDGHYARCAMPWRDARLLKQESKAACIRGQSWGVDRGVVWVDRGCRGLFAAEDGGGYGRYGDDRGDRYSQDDRDGDSYGHRPGGGWQPGPGWDRQIGLQCDSNKKRYQLCQVDMGRNGRARLVRQMSDARCTEGYSWGWNRAGVWVAHGCRGQFVVDRRW